MKTTTPVLLRWAYSLTLLFTVFPFGLVGSGWVAIARGGIDGTMTIVGSLTVLVLALYRIYLVGRVPNTLNSCPSVGFMRLLRQLGVFAIYFGALIAIASVLGGPLIRAFMTSRSESGIEFFIVGVYLSMFSGVGMLGLLCFEFSRLISFERHYDAGEADREGTT